MHLINRYLVEKYSNSPTVQGLIVLSLYFTLAVDKYIRKTQCSDLFRGVYCPTVGRLSWILLYGILRTDINLFLRDILLSIVILVFKKSEYSRFKGRCFLLWTRVELKTEFLGYLKRRVLCSQVNSAASAIANNDVKIKEIISNFCRTTKWLGRLPLVHEFRTSISTWQKKNMRLTARGMGLAQYMFKRAEIVPFFPWGQGSKQRARTTSFPGFSPTFGARIVGKCRTDAMICRDSMIGPWVKIDHNKMSRMFLNIWEIHPMLRLRRNREN